MATGDLDGDDGVAGTVAATVTGTDDAIGDGALAPTALDPASPAHGPDATATGAGAADGAGDARIGRTLGRYRVQARLGAGGMGVVYAGVDLELDRRVALKVLSPRAAGRHAASEARLRREAQALARLDHPNVVRVYDVGVTDAGVYVAMQLVDGTTLAEHLVAARPAPRAIVALFVAAARGLSAAHVAGIVHRDVKPSNLLVDRSGRVCVGDFGLARGAGDRDGAGASSSGSGTSSSGSGAGAGSGSGSGDANLLDEQMTREGSVLGTPLYMSPEQHDGRPATARSDQFSFCVSLWQALFDQHPFVVGAWSTTAAREAMARDAIVAPPATRGVPARVVRALRRGLRDDPTARWPSMDALIAELEPPARTRWVAAGLAVVGLAAGAAAALALGGGADEPCDRAGASIATTWSPVAARALRQAFAATHLAYAGGVADQVVARLDRFAGGWASMRVDACRATRVRGEQSDALLDRRMRCLDRRLAELGGVVAVLTRAPGADVVDRSVALADGLGSLAECADTAALADLVDGPSAPVARAEVAGLEAEVARLRVTLDAGVAKDPIPAADALVAAARRTGAPALLARALLVAGTARDRADRLDDAVAIWREAATAAARAHDDRAATQVLRATAATLTYAGKSAEALQAISDAEVFAARAAADPHVESDLAVARGSALDELGRFPEADAAYQRGVDLEVEANGADSVGAAEAMVDRSKFLIDANRYADAIALLQRAIAVLERALGPTHPDLAVAHGNLGNAYLFAGDQRAARAELERALAIKRARFPADTSTIAVTLQSLGGLDLDAGDLDAAERELEEAHAIRVRTLGRSHPDTLSSLYELGVLHRMRGRYDQARTELEEVLAARIAEGADRLPVANVLDALANVDEAAHQADAALARRRRALAIREGQLGPWADDVKLSWLGIAELEVDRGHCADGLAAVAKALAIIEHEHQAPWTSIVPLVLEAECEEAPAALATLRARLEPLVEAARAGDDVDRKADSQFGLGVVRWKQGDRAGGRALIEGAAAIYRDAGQPDGAASFVAWLAAHGGTR